MKIIYASNTFEEILVDDIDYDLKQFSWTIITHESKSKQVMRGESIGGRQCLHNSYYLGRIIAERIGLNIEDKDIDHIDRNGLNNQRHNLRICTSSQNQCNSKIRKDNTSGYRGVYYEFNRDKYQSYVNINNERVNMGRFDTAEEAAIARDLGALKYHKEFVSLNFPEMKQYYIEELKNPSIHGIKMNVSNITEIIVNRMEKFLDMEGNHVGS